MLLDILIAQQTAGHQGMGGDIPYDDYSLQDTIGGLGAVDPHAVPFDVLGDGSLGASSGAPAFYDTSPSTIGGAPPRVRPYGSPLIPGVSSDPFQSAQLAGVMAALDAGREATPVSGLFGSPRPPAPQPRATQPQPVPAPTPEPKQRVAQSARRPAPVSRAPQVAQAVAAVARQHQAQPSPAATTRIAAPVFRAPVRQSAPRTNVAMSRNR